MDSDYSQVASAEKGLPAGRYQKLTTVRLSPDSVDQLLASDIAGYSNEITSRLPQWATWPEPAQEAVFDMAYNLGVAGFLKYKKLLAAANKGDWFTAAMESHRNGIGDERNAEIAALFRQAAAPVASSADSD